MEQIVKEKSEKELYDASEYWWWAEKKIAKAQLFEKSCLIKRYNGVSMIAGCSVRP